jgi:hypothetical protein
LPARKILRATKLCDGIFFFESVPGVTNFRHRTIAVGFEPHRNDTYIPPLTLRELLSILNTRDGNAGREIGSMCSTPTPRSAWSPLSARRIPRSGGERLVAFIVP